MPMYTHRYVVRGTGAFPLDMLRYDMSSPSRGRDVVTISHSIKAAPHEPLEVELVASGLQKRWEPTAERWASFGWEVVCTESR